MVREVKGIASVLAFLIYIAAVWMRNLLSKVVHTLNFERIRDLF
jgi:hypothetical protein